MQFAYSGFVEQALARYTQGCEAIASGNLKDAAKHFSQSSSLNPSVEALVGLAEVQIALGQWDEALASLGTASFWAREMKPTPQYAIKLKQLNARFKSESKPMTTLPPFSQPVEILIQSKLNLKPLVKSLADIAGIIGGAHSASPVSSLKARQLEYGLIIGEKPDGWDETIAIMALPLNATQNDVVSARHHKNCIYLTCPAAGIAQSIPGQMFLAKDIMDTLLSLCARVDPLFIRIGTSGAMHTPERLYRLGAGNPTMALVQTFVTTMRDDDGCMFTCGMHALGYADAKLSGPIVDVSLVTNVLHEFLECTIANNILPATEVMTFGSAAAQYQFNAIPGPFPKAFGGTAGFNHNGMWTLTPAGAGS